MATVSIQLGFPKTFQLYACHPRIIINSGHLHPKNALKVKVAQLCLTFVTYGLYSPWDSPCQNTGMGSLSLLQGIFPTQGFNTGLLHCRWILYQLSH